MNYTLIYPGIAIFLVYVCFNRLKHPPHSHATTSNHEELKVLKKEQNTCACTVETSQPVYQWGRYIQPILNPNIQAKSFFGDILKDLRLKRWHYLSVTTPTHLVAVAVVQIGYVANVWCYVFNPNHPSESLQEFRLLSPLGVGVSFADSSCSGITKWSSEKNFIQITSDDKKFEVTIDVNSKGKEYKGKFQIIKPKKSLALLYPLETPSSNFPRAAYTHKAAGMKTTGQFTCGGETISMDGVGCMDWTKSFAKRETRWKWVSFSAQVEENKVMHSVGLNMSSGVYEDTENVLFVDEKMYPQAAMLFTQINPKEYSIETSDGAISLKFTLVSVKEENINAVIIKDKFMQACGWYTGVIKVGKGQDNKMVLKIDKCLGVIEEHYALW